MALKDCIRKMKGLVTADDVATLEEYLAEGLNDDEAVRRLLLIADADVVETIKMAEEAGAVIAKRPDFIGEIHSLQDKRAEKIRAERVKLAEEERDLNETLNDSKVVIDVVRTFWSTLPESASAVVHGLDIYDEQQLTTVLSAMLFRPNMRPNLQKGTFGLQGKTPLALVESFKALRDERADIRNRLAEIYVLDAQALAQLEAAGGRQTDTFFQGKDVSAIGLRSGLLSAVRIMPQEKGSASQMMAYLKKQPGVKKEELEWIDFESWAMAKGTVTREEMILYVQENGVQVEEIQYGGARISSPVLQFDVNSNATIDHPDNVDDRSRMTVYDAHDINTTEFYTVYVDHDAEQVSVTPDDGKTWLPVLDHKALPLENARQAIEEYSVEQQRAASPFAEPAEYETFSLPGGMNYREVFLKLPNPLEGEPTAGDLVQAIVAEFRNLSAAKQMEMNDFYKKLLKNTYPQSFTGGRYFISAMRENIVTAEHFEAFGLGGNVIDQHLAELQATRQTLKGLFTSHAFSDVKNILAWMRVNDRVGPNGEKILFVEEVQSDWHSAGRDMGYAVKADKPALEKIVAASEKKKLTAYGAALDGLVKIRKTGTEGGNARSPSSTASAQLRVESVVIGRSDWLHLLNEGVPALDFETFMTEQEVIAIGEWRLAALELAQAKRNLAAANAGIPDAPFKGNAWAELSMKRILRMAAEGGYDQVAWTTGNQQAARYDLGQVVNRINWSVGPAGDGRTVDVTYTDGATEQWGVEADGTVGFMGPGARGAFIGKDLAEIIGQTNSDKIMAEFEGADPLGSEKSMTAADLRVGGGEGMNNFYDKVLVNVTNRAVKKLDKKAKVKRFGGSVTTLPYGPDAEIQPTVHAIDITPEMTAGAMEGQTLFQKEKGSITFDEMRRGLIRLSETRDLSTFLHEAGHLYLETMRGLAEGPGAPQRIQDEWASILKHLKVNAGREITTKEHELFAQSFEKYLSIGKAPSIEMMDAFHSYKRWMELIPGKLKELAGVELSEEITGVFDRMLASERQITEAEQVQEYAAIFSTPEDMGVSREVFNVYRDDAVHAHQEGVDRETKRMLDHMRREEMSWWKAEKKKVRAEVEAEAHSSKLYIALAMLQKGTMPDGSPTRDTPFKLNRDDLIRRYGKDFIKRLPRPFIYSVEGGVDAGVAALRFGYASADAMIQDFARPKGNMKAWIRGETDARMKALYPDPMMSSTLSDNAVRAVHSNRRASVLATEMKALRKRAREDAKIVRATKDTLKRERNEARFANAASLPKKLELEQIKAGARLEIGKKAIRDVRPRDYLNAERRAGKKAFEANGRGDYQQAYMFKRQQIINHELYRAAVNAKAQNEGIQRYLTKFDKPRVQQRLGKSGIFHKIQAVLEGIDFRKRSLTSLDYNKYLKSIIGLIEDGTLVVDPDLARQLQEAGTNWQELTVDQFAGIRDTVKQLEHLAKKLAEGVLNGERAILKTAQDEIANSLYENQTVIDTGVSQPTRKDVTKRSAAQYVTNWLRPSAIARVLDKADFGAITRNIIVPMRRAYSERLIPMIHKAQKDMSELYLEFYTRAELRTFSRRHRVEAMGEDLSKSDILSIALNWGNEGNRSALLGGVKRNGQMAYTEEGVRAALATLTERDWQFVQAVWDYKNTYWKALSEAEQRRRGVAPQKVEASPFKIKTADGKEIVVKGGYFTLAYDKRHSSRVKSQELEDLYKQMGNGVFISTSTRAGSTYERVKNHGMVVKLGLNVIDTHLREIVRDIAVGDEVNFIKRVLNSKTVQDAFHQTGNADALNTLDLWLTDAAVGELPAEGIYEQSASWIRTGFTKSKLAWNITTTFLQFTGVFQTMAVIGSVAYGRGLAKYMQNPRQATKTVMGMSKFLTARYSIGQWDKDVADTKAHLESVFGAQPTHMKAFMNGASATYFWPIAQAQKVVDVTTWLGAFDKGRNEKGYDEAQAILYADSMVEAAQTSGFFSDRSGLERGTLGNRKNRQSQFIRIWTTLISYMLAKGGLAYEKGKATDFRKPSQVATFATDLVMLFVVEGIASALIYGQWPDEADEPEDWAWWVAEKTGESVLSTIPFVREIPGSKFGGGNTPLGSLAHDMWDLQVQIGQGEADDALRRKAITTGGTLLHLPASQTNRFIDIIWAEDDLDWYEYIAGPKD